MTRTKAQTRTRIRPRQKRRGAIATAARSNQRLSVAELGQAVRLDYRRGNKTFTHAFDGAVTVYRSHEGQHLVIAPVRVVRDQIHG